MDHPERPPMPTLDFCCGGKKCPVVTLEHVSGGAEPAIVLADASETVRLTAEQFAKVVAFAREHGFLAG